MTRPDWLDVVVRGAGTVGTTLSVRQREFPGRDQDARKGEGTRHSAVVLVFSSTPDGRPQLLLTERSHTMRSHPGQVSFPGGAVDQGETPEVAALREAEEEVGLDPAAVEVVARLPDLFLPVSDFRVTPVIAWWPTPAPLEATSVDEVEAVYQVPVAELADPDNRIRVRAPSNPDLLMPAFLIGPAKDLILWGFTGGIVHEFLTHLGWMGPVDGAPIVDLPGHMLIGRERGLN